MNDKELWEKGKKSWFYSRFKNLFKEDDVFWNNEIKANMFVNSCLLILAFVMIISYFLAKVGMFEVPMEEMNLVLICNLPLIFIAIALCSFFKGSRHWIKYVLCITSILVVVGLCSTISIFVRLIICIPVLLSTRYYSRRFTIFISILSIIAMFVSQIVYGMGYMIDLNLVQIPHYTNLYVTTEGLRGAVIENGYDMTQYIINLMRGSFAPDLLIYIIVSYICAELARRAHEMVLEQQEISQKAETIKTELQTATNIQTSVLPKIFPPFPARPEIDIYATMNAAKEVGGDFYDYYFIDEDHLVIVIADVSGKGIPAALFMMISKALFNTYADIYKSPAKIADAVNKKLCEDNEVNMFVTAWLGIIELSTGNVTAVDCGHEYPFVKHGDGQYSLFKDKKSFVLAGMETAKYKEFTFHLDKGDTLFLYTDGVPEATNSDEKLYGIKRLEKILNKNVNATTKELLSAVQEDVNSFVDDASPFDDLTMVALHLNKE